MYSEYKKFNVIGNSNTFLFISVLSRGIHAWEVESSTSLVSRLVKVKEIKDGEVFLKSIGAWEKFEKEYTSPEEVADNVNVKDTPIRTKEISKIEKKESNMVAVKVDEPVKKEVATKLNETLQGEVVKRRGRPKGSKNKPKEG